MKWICSCLNEKVRSSWISRHEDVSTIKWNEDCVTVHIIASVHSKCWQKCTAESGEFAGSLPHGGLKRRLVKHEERIYLVCLMDRDTITVNWVVKIDNKLHGIGKRDLVSSGQKHIIKDSGLLWTKPSHLALTHASTRWVVTAWYLHFPACALMHLCT